MLRKHLFCLLMLTVPAVHANSADESRGKHWEFNVYLDGKPIGYHTFEVEEDGAREVLTTEASFDVKFLFVTAFRYRHQNTEVWNDGCLSSIDAATDSNGKKFEVRGSAAVARFDLQSSSGSRALPSCVRTFAYWKPTVLSSSQLLNSQTGAYEDVSITLDGRDEVSVAGQTVEALRYRLSAETGDIKLWYSAVDNTWLGLEAPAKGGRKIFYEAVVVPESLFSQQTIASSD